MTVLTAARLRQVLDYNPDTGIFTWQEPHPKAARMKGKHAGRVADGVVQIKIDGVAYLAHRLVWLYVHGRWPENDIDHKNGQTDDNRFSNLRDATRAQNAHNRRLKNGGVNYKKSHKGWVARIYVNGTDRHLGVFATKDLASAAFRKASEEIRGDFSVFKHEQVAA